MSLDSLHDLFVNELKDLYNAENQLLKALPKMAKKASAAELQAAFTEHLEVTRGQVERLEQVFAELGVSPKGKKCKAMEGLIEEGKEVIEEDGNPAVIDAALIACAQRVEHYEIAGYGCVRTYANLLGFSKAAGLLQETLDEEGEADKTLTEPGRNCDQSSSRRIRGSRGRSRRRSGSGCHREERESQTESFREAIRL